MLNRQTMAGGLVTVGGGMSHAEVEASSSTGRPRLCRATTPSHLTSNSDSRNGDEGNVVKAGGRKASMSRRKGRCGSRHGAISSLWRLLLCAPTCFHILPPLFTMTIPTLPIYN